MMDYTAQPIHALFQDAPTQIHVLQETASRLRLAHARNAAHLQTAQAPRNAINCQQPALEDPASTKLRLQQPNAAQTRYAHTPDAQEFAGEQELTQITTALASEAARAMQQHALL